MKRFREWICMKIAWMLPKEVVKWCFFRMTAHATQGKYANTLVPDLAWEVIAKRWEDK